jgi:hypothetical protein
VFAASFVGAIEAVARLVAFPVVSEALAVKFQTLRIFAIAVCFQQRNARNLLLVDLIVLDGLIDEVGNDYEGLTLLKVKVAYEARRLDLKFVLSNNGL